ncbi:RNA-directed DNA polymerase from mobile element jockey [Folsomia candida]|uniref:RNA-directed DNA polymerase from mobile element jockey n=1 Tax=Folsomia candida TaxID=158441 RepID=A0A226EUP3_FOLCA|nr:RNA-directed DNA polymerase from mobile element jockey [Folsomia candida]
MPCSLELKESTNDVIIRGHKLKWDTSKLLDYQTQITDNLTVREELVSYDHFLEAIVDSAEKADMLKKFTLGKPVKKAWFDDECMRSRVNVKLCYKTCLKLGWSQENANSFHEAKKSYKDCCKKKKLEHLTKIRDKLSSCSNPTEFWSSVRYFRTRISETNQVKEQTWLDFYDEMLPPAQIISDSYTGNENVEAERLISKEELDLELARLKSNKATGPDLIPNECLKFLPDAGRLNLLNLFNNYIRDEKTPPEWSKSITVMLYKKGDPALPVNYRPIALLNSCLKLFTRILSSRLNKWSEDNNILPEAQCGFRAKRGTDDQIFCLNTAIQLSITKKRGKLFACFFDFSRAFPSCSHKKLWDKLYKLGAPGKLIRIFKYIYEKASTNIRLANGTSKDILLTEGILQGDSASTYIFNLFVAEPEKVLIEGEDEA